LIGQPSTRTHTLDHPDKPDNDPVVIARPTTAIARLSPLSLPDLIGQPSTRTHTLDHPDEPDNDTVATTRLTTVIARLTTVIARLDRATQNPNIHAGSSGRAG